jgi:glycosyltransferase involved in cell wall biosynthesis
MEILYIPGLHPLPGNDSAGIFITNRLVSVKKAGIGFQCIVPVVQRDFFTRAFLSLLKKGKSIKKWPASLTVNEIEFSFYPRKMNIYKRFFRYDQNSYWLYERIKNIADGKKITLIHAHSVYPQGHIACFLSKELGVPYVVTAHGSDILILPKKYPEIKPLILETLENANASIFVSEQLLRAAKSLGFSGINSSVIPNGVNINHFVPLNQKAIRNELGIAENHKVIGFVGSLIPVKRADSFYSIFSSIESEIPDIYFLIVGDGLLKSRIEKQFRGKNNIKFVGRVSPKEVPYYINAMDLLILPSRSEGFACVTLEANACGVPVLGTRVGGIPEAVGEGGRLVEDGPDFEKRFSKAAIDILKNAPFNRDLLRERAKRFSWDHTVQQEIEIYKRIYEG